MRLFSDIKISETILIALIPLLGYIAAFFYEVGKFYVLKVPLEYIQINIELILLSSLLTFSISLIAIIFFLILGKIPKASNNNKTKYILGGTPVTKSSFWESIIITFLIPILVAVFLFIFSTLPILYIAIVSIGLLILFVGVLFLPPLVRFPEEKNYRTKFEKYSDEEYKKRVELAKIEMKKKIDGNDLFNLFGLLGIGKEHQFYSYIKITIYSIIWAALAFILGAESMTTSIYSTSKINNKDYIVLGIYSDKFILVGVDKKKKITTNEILLLSNEKDIQVTSDNIGIINEQKKNTLKRF
jgi:hypothetical protein